MATPHDAPYKVEQRNLRARAEAQPLNRTLPRNERGSFINEARAVKARVVARVGSVRILKRLRSAELRAAKEAA